MLSKLFSGGAADLVKNVGGVIDNLHTSKEEKLEAERKIKELVANYQIEMEKNITSRWEADLKSDSWLSKNVIAINTFPSGGLAAPEASKNTLPNCPICKAVSCDIAIILFFYFFK